jgi:hypothetical protein
MGATVDGALPAVIPVAAFAEPALAVHGKLDEQARGRRPR